VSAGGLAVTPKRICVGFYAALTILTASGKLLITVPTLSSDHSTDTQSATTSQYITADDGVRAPLPAALVFRRLGSLLYNRHLGSHL